MILKYDPVRLKYAWNIFIDLVFSAPSKIEAQGLDIGSQPDIDLISIHFCYVYSFYSVIYFWRRSGLRLFWMRWIKK